MTRLRSALIDFYRPGRVPKVVYISRDILREALCDPVEGKYFNCGGDTYEGIPIVEVVRDGILGIY